MLFSLIFLKNFIREKKNVFLKKIKKLEVLPKKIQEPSEKSNFFFLKFCLLFQKKI